MSLQVEIVTCDNLTKFAFETIENALHYGEMMSYGFDGDVYVYNRSSSLIAHFRDGETISHSELSDDPKTEKIDPRLWYGLASPLEEYPIDKEVMKKIVGPHRRIFYELRQKYHIYE